MARVAVVGLGAMGAPIALNLARAGHEVTGWNRTLDKARPLVTQGVELRDSVAEAVQAAEVAITVLGSADAVRQIALSEILPALPRGALYIDMSTVPPSLAQELAQEGGRYGVDVLDAPVSGGQQGAIDGTLTVIVGGAHDCVERARPVLAAVGTTITHVGPAGSGQIVKAASQLVVGGTLGLLAEAIVLLEACGIDAATGLSVLASGLAGSRLLDRRGSAMCARDYTPHGRAELHHKDMGIVLDLARAHGVSVPLATWTAQLMAALVAQDLGHLDHIAVLHVVEQLSGRTNTPD
ncbi:NAD(P)-dependent oxidoreductase [Nocardia sp. NPDC051052]|uniref:NAD(P)-dependent oxidoreductase n=1 Tax=Nocardia sp. NPDC051052 TaxID=3364322 RepID=UPI0037A7DFEF